MRLTGKIIGPVFNESVNLQQNDNLPRPTLNRRPSYGYVISITCFRNFQRLINEFHLFQYGVFCFLTLRRDASPHAHLAVRLSSLFACQRCNANMSLVSFVLCKQNRNGLFFFGSDFYYAQGFPPFSEPVGFDRSSILTDINSS